MYALLGAQGTPQESDNTLCTRPQTPGHIKDMHRCEAEVMPLQTDYCAGKWGDLQRKSCFPHYLIFYEERAEMQLLSRSLVSEKQGKMERGLTKSIDCCIEQ